MTLKSTHTHACRSGDEWAICYTVVLQPLTTSLMFLFNVPTTHKQISGHFYHWKGIRQPAKISPCCQSPRMSSVHHVLRLSFAWRPWHFHTRQLHVDSVRCSCEQHDRNFWITSTRPLSMSLFTSVRFSPPIYSYSIQTGSGLSLRGKSLGSFEISREF